MLVPRLGRASPLVDLALDEAAAEQPQRGAVPVGAARFRVVHDKGLRDGLRDLLEARPLTLCRAQRFVGLVARVHQSLALAGRLVLRASARLEGLVGNLPRELGPPHQEDDDR